MAGQKNPQRRHLLGEFFDLCAELREVIEDRKNWHSNNHKKDCLDQECKIDPLFHRIVWLNWGLAVKHKQCLAEEIAEGELAKIKAFFKL